MGVGGKVGGSDHGLKNRPYNFAKTRGGVGINKGK